jgi:hypothetical protein
MKKSTVNGITTYLAKIWNLCTLYQVAIYSEKTRISSIPEYFTRKKDAMKYYNKIITERVWEQS